MYVISTVNKQGVCSAQPVYRLGYVLKAFEFTSRQAQMIFLFFISPRPTMGAHPVSYIDTLGTWQIY